MKNIKNFRQTLLILLWVIVICCIGTLIFFYMDIGDVSDFNFHDFKKDFTENFTVFFSAIFTTLFMMIYLPITGGEFYTFVGNDFIVHQGGYFVFFVLGQIIIDFLTIIFLKKFLKDRAIYIYIGIIIIFKIMLVLLANKLYFYS